MDLGYQFDQVMPYTPCISISQFIFIIVIWSTLFTESVILDLIKVFIFFCGCCGASIVQIYIMNDQSRGYTKLLPCGALVMISLSIFAVILIIMHIISKGLMDCVGEFIALFFGVSFLLMWTVIYNVANDHVQLTYYDGERNP